MEAFTLSAFRYGDAIKNARARAVTRLGTAMPDRRKEMDDQPEPKATRTFTEEIELAGSQLIDQVKRMVAEGNVRRVRVRTAEGDEPFLEIPLTGGVIGGGILVLAAPWLAALGALAAVVTKVRVEVVRQIDAEPDESGEPRPPDA